MRDEIMAVQKKLEELKKQSLAMEILKDARKTNKRIFIILITTLCMWFATIGAFVYYINTVDYEEIVETADTGEGGNACVGDNCNNGEINYGISQTTFKDRLDRGWTLEQALTISTKGKNRKIK